jgi:hypothetical protein
MNFTVSNYLLGKELHDFLHQTPGLTDVNEIETKLHKKDVFSIESLVSIDPLDLVAAGISREDILILRENAILYIDTQNTSLF